MVGMPKLMLKTVKIRAEFGHEDQFHVTSQPHFKPITFTCDEFSTVESVPDRNVKPMEIVEVIKRFPVKSLSESIINNDF